MVDSTTNDTISSRDLFTRQECISVDLYSSAQENLLAALPYLTSPLSLVGSSLIIWAIWYDRQVLLKLVYHRLVFAMSVMDWINSFGMIVLGPWTVPADYLYGRPGRGTVNTCTASGVFFSMLTGTVNYSAFLAISFVLTIRWEWKERRIACCMEPFAHFFGFFGPTVNAIIGGANQLINPLWELPGWCWFSDNPPFCIHDKVYCMNEGTLILPDECVRGEDFEDYTTSIGLTFVIFVWGVIVTCMILIVLKVFRMERSLQQYGDPTAALNRTREAANQALSYIAAFLICYLPISLLKFLIQNENDPLRSGKGTIFSFALLTKITVPMIGFLNALIYFRKRFAILIKRGQSLEFLTKIPHLGPWIVARQQPRRARTTQLTAISSNRHSSAMNLPGAPNLATAPPNSNTAPLNIVKPTQTPETHQGETVPKVESNGNAPVASVLAPVKNEANGNDAPTENGPPNVS
mmetsp:Transcript_4125/g.10505  ORF Transcript_4125/g.10505 Transcript_4125/m.10505 type:complete len:465 (-) Transcript_4125:310-1704(-)